MCTVGNILCSKLYNTNPQLTCFSPKYNQSQYFDYLKESVHTVLTAFIRLNLTQSKKRASTNRVGGWFGKISRLPHTVWLLSTCRQAQLDAAVCRFSIAIQENLG